jgi:hypothetical protein
MTVHGAEIVRASIALLWLVDKCLLVGLFGSHFLMLSPIFHEAIHVVAMLPFFRLLTGGNNVNKVGNSNITDGKIMFLCNSILITYQWIFK